MIITVYRWIVLDRWEDLVIFVASMDMLQDLKIHWIRQVYSPPGPATTSIQFTGYPCRAANLLQGNLPHLNLVLGIGSYWINIDQQLILRISSWPMPMAGHAVADRTGNV